MTDFLILGAGFTAARVARRLVEAGADVVVTNRQLMQLAGARCLAFDITAAADFRLLEPLLAPATVILHSIPALPGTPELVKFLRPFRPARMVYFSTTGVYGDAQHVDEHTAPNPQTDKDRQRMEAERTLAEGPWSTLVLRPAAIYGPRRGVHWSARQGTFRPAAGNRIVSRIHVDDLTAHAVRAMQCTASGAFPVADEEPCSSSDVVLWTLRQLRLPVTAGAVETPTGGRRVDGSAVRTLLGIELRYRSFREGVAACLEEEA